MTDRLISFDTSKVTPEHDAPAPDRLIEGAPRFTTWNLDEADDGKMFSGIWESSPGKWRVEYDEWEFCSIVTGVSVLEGEDGRRTMLRPGDSIVIRPGFRGTWEVVETTRKLYVIRLS